jgi:hypothetical protein
MARADPDSDDLPQAQFNGQTLSLGETMDVNEIAWAVLCPLSQLFTSWPVDKRLGTLVDDSAGPLSQPSDRERVYHSTQILFPASTKCTILGVANTESKYNKTDVPKQQNPPCGARSPGGGRRRPRGTTTVEPPSRPRAGPDLPRRADSCVPWSGLIATSKKALSPFSSFHGTVETKRGPFHLVTATSNTPSCQPFLTQRRSQTSSTGRAPRRQVGRRGGRTRGGGAGGGEGVRE